MADESWVPSRRGRRGSGFPQLRWRRAGWKALNALLGGLREAGACEQAAKLLTAGMFGLFLKQEGRADQFLFGWEPDGTPAAAWDWDDLD